MVKEHKYISLDYIINKIKSNPLMVDLNTDAIIGNCVTVMRLIGIPMLVHPDYCVVPVNGGIAKIPQHSENIRSVFYANTDKQNLDEALIVNDNNEFCTTNGISLYRMVDNTDALDFIPGVVAKQQTPAHSFTLHNNRIIVNRKQGCLLVVYDKIATDNNGIPLTLDKESVLLAMENYVKKEYFNILFDINKLPNRQSLEIAAQQYSWYVGQAQSELAGFQSEGEIESFLNYFTRLYKENSSFMYRDAYNNIVQLRKPL